MGAGSIPNAGSISLISLRVVLFGARVSAKQLVQTVMNALAPLSPPCSSGAHRGALLGLLQGTLGWVSCLQI